MRQRRSGGAEREQRTDSSQKQETSHEGRSGQIDRRCNINVVSGDLSYFGENFQTNADEVKIASDTLCLVLIKRPPRTERPFAGCILF